MKVAIKPIRLIVTHNVATVAAKMMTNQVRNKPKTNLGVATGRTYQSIYPLFIEMVHDQGLDVSALTIFGLDEYLGYGQHHYDRTFRAAIERALETPLGLREDQIKFPYYRTEYPQFSSSLYEMLITKLGGIDLQLLGIGRNGHIGFNEPGSLFTSVTRVVNLTLETQEANGVDKDQAMTQGLGTIAQARRILVVADTKAKATAVRMMLMVNPNINWPASSLRLHDDVTVIINPAAASKLPPNLQQIGIHRVG